ncbi:MULTISPECIES: GTP-binding protein [unclassified Clostridium]|uniref:GTP-binding protein n=1 Tax=unclassified Clostridium TaxID=2614128 RepID=UPI00189979C2|nr:MULTISPECIES: GTP-binding protein [unclassified Clostridium]MCR1950139.1 GTP-binding protein [Clostridium sp. DSM 100503]
MKIKIDIYSGFLGAGKTFLMKKLITEGAYEKNIAIIENEFGEVSIDAAILRQSNIEVKEINSGCICCQVTGDFKEAILEVIEKYHPDRIIIEPSGVAKLTDIIKVFKEGKLKEKSEVDNIITVIDPEKFDMYINNFKDFYEDQILNTKKIVLSRVQKLNYEEVQDVVSKIKKLNRRAVIIREDWNKIKGKDILNQNNSENLNLKGNNSYKAKLTKKLEEHKKADEVFETFAIYPNSKISKSELISKFKFISSSKSYGDVLRAKGIVKLLDGSNGQFDFVKDEFEIREIKDNTNSVISFIGIKLNKEELKQLFK